MIQSVDRAIRILMELQEGRPLALSELAARLKLSPSTTHGLLKTLAVRGLVRQDKTSRYYMGPAVVGFANAYLGDFELPQVLPLIKRFVDKTNCPVHIGVLSGKEIIVIHRELPLTMSFYMKRITKGIPAHCSAMGKAILAQEPQLLELFEDPLTRRTARTIPSLAELRKRVKSIRDKYDGVAFEREELNIAESSVAVPIFGRQNRVIGAIAAILETSYPKPKKETQNELLDDIAEDEEKRLKRENKQNELLKEMVSSISKIADDITDVLGGDPIIR